MRSEESYVHYVRWRFILRALLLLLANAAGRDVKGTMTKLVEYGEGTFADDLQVGGNG